MRRTFPFPTLAVVTCAGLGLAGIVAFIAWGAHTHARHEEREEAKAGLSGAAEALDLWAAQRAYPNPVVPDVGYAAAWEAERSRVAAGDFTFDDVLDPWIALGPANIGGRTLALAIRPDNPLVIFAGSASGGLWKSTTGGIGADAWDYVDTGFPVPGVSTIAIDPAHPDVMYIGTGEVYRYQGSIGGTVLRTTRGSYGIGILKSTDGGATWVKSIDWTRNQTRGVWMIRVHPHNSNIVWAATTEGTYKSLNAGATWTLAHSVIMATDVRVHPTMPETVFVACGNLGSGPQGIYRTLNGGASWAKLAGGLPASWSGKAMLEIAPSAPATIFASIADSVAGRGLWKSTNAGGSWSRVSATDYPTYQGWYSHWVMVNPNDANKVYVGGIDIWRSTAGGSGLTQISDWSTYYLGTPPPEGPSGGSLYAHADQHCAVWHPTAPNTFYVGSDGGVFRTTNGGTSFESCNGHYMTTQFYNGFSSSAGNRDLAMGGLQDNFTAIYRGGEAWERVIGGDGCWTAIHPANDAKLYAEYQYLSMLRSDDDGVNWWDIAPPELSGDVTPFTGPFVLCPSSPSTLYAGRSRVYKSTDEGNNWSTTGTGLPFTTGNAVLSMAVSSTSPDTLYCATAPIASRARVYRTRNGGAVWQDVTGTLPDRYPIDMAVDPANSNRVFIVFSGFGTSHLYRSVNGAATWTDIGAGLPDVPTSAVAIDPDHPEVIYVGNDLGVYVSLDDGVTWQPFSRGMPTAMVSDLRVFRPARLLRAATHGNGVFERPLIDPAAASVASGGGPGGAGGTGGSAPPAIAISPNPAGRAARVAFTLPARGVVEIGLYDAAGRLALRVANGEFAAGRHERALDAGALAPGVYFARLDAGGVRTTTRVVIAR